MTAERLEPRLDLLREEYVLVQAWKKTASYIRYHNWFADTLALDRAAVNLPSFLGELRERLSSPQGWQNDPLRIVPAPKSQQWSIQNGKWGPAKGPRSALLRPLAHASLADQVVATGLMLCLADRVETLQGDPRQPVPGRDSGTRVISYGNRLFCDAIGDELRHRWGSAKLYRAYYQDYRTFLSRPEAVAKSIPETSANVYVVHADIRQFYDRVRPELLSAAINRIRHTDDDPAFFSLAASVLNWEWHPSDEGNVRTYTEQAELDNFAQVALPQGLVASGFFANAVLLPFDEELCSAIGTNIAPGIQLIDVCRYVDDLRVVVGVNPGSDDMPNCLSETVSGWLNQVLEKHAGGLALSDEKTKVAALGGDQRPLVRQSTKMRRIQSAVSGGFDALGGGEILDAIQGLMRTQDALGVRDDADWSLSPVPDVRDETVARFSAHRYRVTFRSIRPLLRTGEMANESQVWVGDLARGGELRVPRTRQELDEDARAFALGLIRRWIEDPSNVRLLRVGLDLWPDVALLREVLSLLRPFTEKGGRRKAPRRVAWYCLSEVLRAGATETGLVPDTESLPAAIDLGTYRDELCNEAVRLVALPGPTIPWYLRQQALLFLAACDPGRAPVKRTGTVPETRHYREVILFLRGEGDRLRLTSSEFATLAVLARRAFADRERAAELVLSALTPARIQQIARKAPAFFLELVNTGTAIIPVDYLPARVREDLCVTFASSDGDNVTLAEAVLAARPTGPLRNELSLLRFAAAFLKRWREQDPRPEVITPIQVQITIRDKPGNAAVDDVRIFASRTKPSGSLYEPPSWCDGEERWRVQLGFLLRFILSGHRDFTRPVRPASWKEREPVYRAAENHWYQRLYGFHTGQPAFGDDWLPISDWTESFLLALLRWPGCRRPDAFGWVGQGVEATGTRISERIADLEQRFGMRTGALMLPLLAKRPTATDRIRPLRACVVQTALPADNDFRPADLSLDDPEMRRKHRNHLSAALAAVERMLELRETHKEGAGQLDWLILPELAVHPRDVRTHLVPFSRAHKAIILTGLTYQEILSKQPLVNSALWVIPEWSEAYGLQIKTRRQCKAHLAPNEQAFNGGGEQLLQGFRPCQWLIGYPWSPSGDGRHLCLTAAVCYDATDLRLAADLRAHSDVLAIPALNQDVKTFDQMALALHYHMFQLVIVANSGQYGGSNAYWPRREAHVRQIFHTYGQPQASIAFLEIEDIGAFVERRDASGGNNDKWKYPPAGIGGP